jgi:ketosteroid isomerase-like protein
VPAPVHGNELAAIRSPEYGAGNGTLPTANTEITQFFRQWLEIFAGYVREVDYASARPLFTDFRFVLEQTSVLASPDGMMATVIAPWTSTGYHPDGRPFPRSGRATLVFSGNADDWLWVHSHMSLNRGVPQASHANRR